MRPLVLFLFISILPSAGAAAAAKASGPAVTTGGYVDAYYSYNPAGVVPALRVFDVSDNTFKTAVVGYSVVVDGEKTGARVDLVFGQSADLVAAGNAEHKFFQQAYATLKMGDSAFDIGKFVTHLGYEVIPGKDNANLSRSLLFGYTIPFDHTGVRLTKPLGNKIKAMVHLIDTGWAAENSANSDKTFGAQLIFAPDGEGSIILNGITGAERASDVSTKRTVVEMVMTRRMSGALSMGLDCVFGRQGFTPDGSVQVWSGVAGYASHAFAGDWTLSGRAEQFNNSDAALYSPGAVLREWTLTLAKKVENLLLRAEWRQDLASSRDGGTQAAFPDPERGLVSAQRTWAIGAVFSF